MTTTNGTTSPTNGHDTHPLPIVIAGGGCVGLFLALLLCQSNIPNKVVIVEPEPPTPASTRAMAHQPLIFPLFASAGLMPSLSSLGCFSSGLCFRTSVANGNKLIAGKQFQEGDKAQLLLPQYKFQELLIQKVREAGGEILMGKKVVDFTESAESVTIQIHPADHDGSAAPEELKAHYLIGADGAHSTIRRTLGLSFDGTTLDTHLVATDILFDFHAHGFYDANFIIDPEDYGLVGRIDDSGLWRVSYGVPGDTPEEDITKGVDGKLAKMLPNGGRNERDEKAYVIQRVAPYRAQQRVVSEFWKAGGRVGVLGDAAHLTNPYAGLGLASGIADASSLATVLIHILSPTSPSPFPPARASTLLTSWSRARRALFLSVVDKPSRAAYTRVKSKVDTDGEVQGLLERDPLVGALKRGMPMMPPSLVTRGEELEGW